ncbi:hypothetical protein D0T23_07190 [Duganella sp. BJB475]|nr:hypothetical protein D0T23_07190 [Duganella sp. BJB475]RFP36125.1 hypothetical protein D0T21_06735 [Duganella sp. BJB476]
MCAVLAIGSCMLSSAHAADSRGPATPEEIARVVQIAAAADKDPVATMASADGRWFQKWSDDVPDYSFGPDQGAFWLMNGAAKGELKRVAIFQHMVSTAAYQVQHQIHDPQKSKDEFEAKTVAGLEGVLRAYQNLLAANPDNRSAPLDDAVAARDKGTLLAFVRALPPMPKR